MNPEGDENIGNDVTETAEMVEEQNDEEINQDEEVNEDEEREEEQEDAPEEDDDDANKDETTEGADEDKIPHKKGFCLRRALPWNHKVVEPKFSKLS